MKQVLLFTVLLFSSIYSSAQSSVADEVTPKNEIGLPFFSARNLQFSKLNNSKPTIELNYVMGGWYKRHFGKNALRVNLEFMFNRVNEEYNFGTGYWSRLGTRKGAGISVGYERKLFTNKWQPFFGGDIGYAYWNESGLETVCGCFTCYQDAPYNGNYHQLKLTSFVGLRYSITPKFSLTVESSYGLYSTFGVYRDLLDLRLNPVQSLGVSYHF